MFFLSFYWSGGEDAGAGSFAGFADNVRLVEWRLVMDGGAILFDNPVPGGGC